jgi:alpha-glucosidase
LPWSGTRPPFGFSPAGATAEPWLRQPGRWTELTVEAEQEDPRSMLSLYRSMLVIRRENTDLVEGNLRWLASEDDVLSFARGERFVCVTNFSSHPIELPSGCSLLLASADLTEGRLPSDASAWLRFDQDQTQDRTIRCPTEGGK